MGADVRIEIIYFKQDSDIKLEFGLSSDYPIRLLSSKVSDEANFLKRLKTASLRSPIIITVGGFYDTAYLPEIIAKATNLEMTEMDSGKYKTQNNQTVMLPNGAVPIIYSDGTFNGCVLESGPQSIIMLPEDDTNRMKLIKELIVPYISEHYKTYNLEQNSAESELVEKLPTESEFTEQPVGLEEQQTEPTETAEISEQSEQVLPEPLPVVSEQSEVPTEPPVVQNSSVLKITPEPIEFEELDSGKELDLTENSVLINGNPEEVFDNFFFDDTEPDLPKKFVPKSNSKSKKRHTNGGINAVLTVASVLLLSAVAIIGYLAYKYFL